MDETQRRVDEIRKQRSELENHLIDEYAAGKITRAEFIRRGTVVGMSIPLVSFIAAACGGGGGGTAAGTTGGGGKPKAGGTIRTGIIAPAASLDPIKVADEGGLAVLGQSGEYLNWSDSKLHLQPRLAESWSPNDDGSVWTFKIRQGVKFNDGTPMTAKDVAATIDTHADPANGSNALSVFTGVLSKGNTKAVDDSTVEVTLDAPNGNFPYLVSSDNYNLIILPAGFDMASWDKSFLGTGPWKLEKYTPNQGVSYVKNPNYWDTNRQPLPDRSEVKFYKDEQARVLAIQGGQVDVVSNFSVAGGKALLTDPSINVIEIRASQHREMHMRTDQDPFTDKRVRQAVALLIDRQALVQGLFEGKADLGNDSPFAPVFPSTDTSVAQREQDVDKAKQLLAEAGKGSGFQIELRTWNGFEIPQLAQLVQDALKQANISVKLNITDPGTYYGDAVFGKSPWLDSTFGITDYGHRGVPNVFLTAPLTSKGPWNSAHFKNPTYDGLVADYVAALDVDAQKQVAKKIEELLLDETPIVFPYFYFHLAAEKNTFTGAEPTGMGHIDVSQAGSTG
ncbi:MAG TPA: ABC transporter substrate-binding protein [Gaiellaceae bacterium]|jgi:peptide/nickel transport system substrate-binding protein|nr:ABC transporter substrate-binding protein [Gaiellaceae bacterium]